MVKSKPVHWLVQRVTVSLAAISCLVLYLTLAGTLTAWCIHFNTPSWLLFKLCHYDTSSAALLLLKSFLLLAVLLSNLILTTFSIRNFFTGPCSHLALLWEAFTVIILQNKSQLLHFLPQKEVQTFSIQITCFCHWYRSLPEAYPPWCCYLIWLCSKDSCLPLNLGFTSLLGIRHHGRTLTKQVFSINL